MKKLIIILFLLSTVNLFSQSVTPAVFNIQGVLRTPTGKAAIDGDYRFTFRMFGGLQSVTRIGTWEEVQTIKVTNGIYNALIGSATPFTGLAFDRTYFVEIEVNGSVLQPRVQLTASPYALSLQGTNNKVPNSGAMQFDKDVWHKSADGKDRIKFVNNAETQINSRVKDQYGFLVPAGSIIAFAGSTAPDGWFLCDGTEKSQTTYSDLYNVLQATYGSASSGNFRLPNLNGRFIAGAGTSTSTSWNQSANAYTNPTTYSFGQNGGSNNHKLTTDEMPLHTHKMFSQAQHGQTGSQTTGSILWHNYNDWWWDHQETVPTDFSSSPAGGNQPHNITPPFLGLNYIIKY